MSLSKHLQSPQILETIASKKPDELRTLLMNKGREWYTAHPEESEKIRNNLSKFGESFSDELIFEIERNVILHYYEKLLPLCGTPQFYNDFLENNVDTRDAAALLKNASEQNQGILIAAAHFGAVELIVPTLSWLKHTVNIVLRFTTEKFSNVAKVQGEKMTASGYFGEMKFIEIGKPGTMSALEMAGALRRKEVLVSVFDEETEYSIPVNLLKKKVFGGAGLDRLLRFSSASVAVFNAFMIRTDTNKYLLKLIPLDFNSGNPVQEMYKNLENIIKKYIEQWYFLHEEIPFCD